MIDCDDVPGGAEALGQIRNTPANKQTYILAIVNGSTGTRAAIALGANFVLSKPIQQTLPGILPVAIAEMEREHRRYFRYDVDLPVWFQNALGQSCTARMKNVSESGLAIKPVDPVGLRGRIKVKFELPSIQPQTFHAKADVVWSDSSVAGLRFVHIEKESGIALQGWLTSLEGRSLFQQSAPNTN